MVDCDFHHCNKLKNIHVSPGYSSWNHFENHCSMISTNVTQSSIMDTHSAEGWMYVYANYVNDLNYGKVS